jgi:transposase
MASGGGLAVAPNNRRWKFAYDKSHKYAASLPLRHFRYRQVPDETGWRVGGYPAWLHTLVSPQATAYVIDPTRSGAVAEDILGLDYDGIMIHDGWSPYDQFEDARHQQCLNHLLRRADEMAATATRGAVCFPRRVAELLRAGLDLRDRHATGDISRHGLVVACGRLENQLSDLIFPNKTNAANERLAQHLWSHRNDLFTFLRQPGLDAANWRAELVSASGSSCARSGTAAGPGLVRERSRC